GEVVADPSSLGSSSVSLSIRAGSLAVQAEGESAEDIPKVQARMEGSELLDVMRFPEIRFESASVLGRGQGQASLELLVSGDLSLHGVKRRLAFPVRVEVESGTLTATGRTVLRQTAFGLTPVSVGGVVKVKDEVIVEYKFVGTSTP
ncbi:MAG: YceI family protein, partial [Vicinamibacteria bacterium]